MGLPLEDADLETPNQTQPETKPVETVVPAEHLGREDHPD